MRVLLSGATGFIGKCLNSILLNEHIDAVHLVRKPSGLTNEVIWDFCSALPNVGSVDVIVHLAAYVSFAAELEPEQYLVNTMGTYHLARLSKAQKIPLIFASMAGVHGISGHFNKHSKVYPVNHYGMSKYLAEELIRTEAYAWTILRIGGVYGFNGPAHLGLNKSIGQAYAFREAPLLRGSGAGKRNYISVDDAAQWIASIVVDTPRYADQFIYFANPQILSIREYLTAVAKILADDGSLREEPGADGADMVIESDPAPFALSTFEGYLQKLCGQRGAAGK